MVWVQKDKVYILYTAIKTARRAFYFNSCISSSNIASKLKGSNGTPSPMKCLLIASTQCRRRECNIADVPSITTNTATVSANQSVKQMKMTKMPRGPVKEKALPKVMLHRTMESC